MKFKKKKIIKEKPKTKQKFKKKTIGFEKCNFSKMLAEFFVVAWDQSPINCKLMRIIW